MCHKRISARALFFASFASRALGAVGVQRRDSQRAERAPVQRAARGVRLRRASERHDVLRDAGRARAPDGNDRAVRRERAIQIQFRRVRGGAGRTAHEQSPPRLRLLGVLGRGIPRLLEIGRLEPVQYVARRLRGDPGGRRAVRGVGGTDERFAGFVRLRPSERPSSRFGRSTSSWSCM